MSNKVFNLLQKRDFGDIIQDSIQFVIANFKTYLKAIVFYVGPIYLIVSIIQATFLKDIQKMSQEMVSGFLSDPGNMASNMEAFTQTFQEGGMMGGILLSSLVSIIASLLLVTVITGIVVSYRQNPGEEVPLTSVREKLSSYIMPYLGLMLLSMLLFFVIYIGGILLVIASGMMFKPLAVILGIGLFIVIFYVAIVLVMPYPVMMEEGVGPVDAIKRSFQLIKGHWWETFGVLVVLGLISMVGSLVVGGLSGVLGLVMGEMATSTTMIAVTTLIATLVSGIFSGLVLTGVILQYYNLQEEREDLSTTSRIDDIGQAEESEEEDYNY